MDLQVMEKLAYGANGHLSGFITASKGNRTGAPRSPQRTWAEKMGAAPTIALVESPANPCQIEKRSKMIDLVRSDASVPPGLVPVG
jgi:hypothetical protein